MKYDKRAALVKNVLAMTFPVLIMAFLAYCNFALFGSTKDSLAGGGANQSERLLTTRAALQLTRPPPAFNPLADVKSEIMARAPAIYSAGRCITARPNIYVTNADELANAVYYLFVTNDYDGLETILKYLIGAFGYNSYGLEGPPEYRLDPGKYFENHRDCLHRTDALVYTFVSLLDHTLLKVAYLSERLALHDTSIHFYTRYRRIILEISQRMDVFCSKRIQRRVTLSGYKVDLLKHSLPGLRAEYYRYSPFNGLLEQAIDPGRRSATFARYRIAGVLTPKREERRSENEVDNDPLTPELRALQKHLIAVPATEDPYIHFEACAFAWSIADDDDTAQTELCPYEHFSKLRKVTSKNAVFYPYLALLEARHDRSPEAKIAKLRTLAESTDPAFAHVRDDALYFMSRIQLRAEGYEAALATTKRLILEFPFPEYDAAPIAEYQYLDLSHYLAGRSKQ